ncbi:uncharacterized protein LOC134259948 [Saccostrea cucullata]|uniref:uncharacterized protein LOC134259948 n=1 Tax=Saccostrea cuccullata TaxID=36930 RepID=UPI002ED5D579
MSDCDFGDCDCDGYCCECGDCDCCRCDEDFCECCDIDCIESCFTCCHCLHACGECCRGNERCCGDNSVRYDVSVEGSTEERGCNWCICFLVGDSYSARHQRPQRSYELDRSRQIEVQMQPNSRSLPCAANGVNPAHPAPNTTRKKRTAEDEESDTPQQTDNEDDSPPAVITAQPPSYDEVIHGDAKQRDTVITAQPV